jgi:creatinine amidohydrolase/Fe(II)-dependent formamide hydrolase-like protein
MQPNVNPWLPDQVNVGPWLTHYTVNELESRIETDRARLPICSIGTPHHEITRTGQLVLPPLYHEALDEELKSAMLERIRDCFPYVRDSRRREKCAEVLDIAELPREQISSPSRPRVLVFSVDTAVEQHGPHLPLATDTIQSYGVLEKLAAEFDGFVIGPPVDYGHLTWGLPRGFSIDIGPDLLVRYVTGFVNAVLDWAAPEAIYVVDVHGSPVHRQCIQQGLAASRAKKWRFRWLHEPLVEFAFERGDQHAGGVETAMIEQINPRLLDPRWWPDRVDELAADEMPVERAIELSADLPRFVEYAEITSWNGIVGRVRNYFSLDGRLLMDRVLDLARSDVQSLYGSS